MNDTEWNNIEWKDVNDNIIVTKLHSFEVVYRTVFGESSQNLRQRLMKNTILLPEDFVLSDTEHEYCDLCGHNKCHLMPFQQVQLKIVDTDQ